MVERRVVVHLTGSKGSLDVRMVVDPDTRVTRIPRSIAEEIGAARKGRIELDGESRTVTLRVVPNGEGNCPALGLTAIEGLGLKAAARPKKAGGAGTLR